MSIDTGGKSAGLHKTCTYESFKNSFAYVDSKYKGLFAEQVECKKPILLFDSNFHSMKRMLLKYTTAMTGPVCTCQLHLEILESQMIIFLLMVY